MAFFENDKWHILYGLLAGVFVSLGRLGSNEWIFRKVFNLKGEKAAVGSITAFTASQLVLMLIIIIAYFISVWVLYGLIAGILAVPVIIMINSITEAFGITKNNFE
jgi:hypothetical protein